MAPEAHRGAPENAATMNRELGAMSRVPTRQLEVEIRSSASTRGHVRSGTRRFKASGRKSVESVAA